MRINPNAQNEWYYIVKAIEEAGVAKKITIPQFIEQMMEWFPILFPSSSLEEWEKFKRRLSKSISEEKGLWKYGMAKEVIPLRDMWAKKKHIRIDQAKMERIYQIHESYFQAFLPNTFFSLLKVNRLIKRPNTNIEVQSLF